MAKAFAGTRAPSTLGSFLRAFTWGHVRQLQSAARAFTCRLAGHCRLLPGADQVVYLDIDSKVKPVYGAAKQGAEHGYTKVRGLHFQIVVASTPLAAPVVVAERLRKGSAGSAKGAASLIAEAMPGAGHGRHRHGRGPCRLGVLLPQGRRRLPPSQGPLLPRRRPAQEGP